MRIHYGNLARFRELKGRLSDVERSRTCRWQWHVENKECKHDNGLRVCVPNASQTAFHVAGACIERVYRARARGDV